MLRRDITQFKESLLTNLHDEATDIYTTLNNHYYFVNKGQYWQDQAIAKTAEQIMLQSFCGYFENCNDKI